MWFSDCCIANHKAARKQTGLTKVLYLGKFMSNSSQTKALQPATTETDKV